MAWTPLLQESHRDQEGWSWRASLRLPLKSLVEPKLQWNAGQSSFDCIKESLFLCAERLPNNNRWAAWVCVSHPETDHLLVGASFREDGGHSAHLSHLKKKCSTWWATAAAGSPKFKSHSGVKIFFFYWCTHKWFIQKQTIWRKTNSRITVAWRSPIIRTERAFTWEKARMMQCLNRLTVYQQ